MASCQSVQDGLTGKKRSDSNDEFFVIKNDEGYLLDCNGNSVEELVKNLSKYKIRSKVAIEDLSSNFVVGIINFEILSGELQ